MRRTVQSLVLSLFASAILSAPLRAEEIEDIWAHCEREAKESGITDADEKAEFIKACVADLTRNRGGVPASD